jgi:(p)ppGpp synthase/HD superfamily hydrolase
MFSPAIERALRLALAAHEGQFQKGPAVVPYVVHPLHIAVMLARWGMEEDLIVAGLLHDVVEDCPGWTLERIAEDFGAHVASIVGQLTEDKSKSWEDRKRRAVEHVPHLSPEAATVKATDLLHNLYRLVDGLRESPDPAEVWKRFKGGRERTLEHYAALVEALAKRTEPRIARALEAGLKALGEQTERDERRSVVKPQV